MDFHWFTSLEDIVNQVTGDPFLSRIILAVAMGIVTIIVGHILIGIVRKFLEAQDNPLAKSSFYRTIIHIGIWGLGLCVILDTCFQVNMSAFIAALGVGGIALSLGFQDTLSNLFGGIAMTFTRSLKPGDNIEVSGYTGVVQDITWRQTTIYNGTQTVIVPNSVLAKNPVVHQPPLEQLIVPVTTVNNKDIDKTTAAMVAAIRSALESMTTIKVGPSILYTGLDSYGVLTGDVYVQVEKEGISEDKVYDLTDAISRAVAPFSAGKDAHAQLVIDNPEADKAIKEILDNDAVEEALESIGSNQSGPTSETPSDASSSDDAAMAQDDSADDADQQRTQKHKKSDKTSNSDS